MRVAYATAVHCACGEGESFDVLLIGGLLMLLNKEHCTTTFLRAVFFFTIRCNTLYIIFNICLGTKSDCKIIT